MDYKKTNATKTTVTNNTKLFEDKVGNIYSAIVALEKRSNQISSELKEELLGKLDEFATQNDNLDEIFENKEQIESNAGFAGCSCCAKCACVAMSSQRMRLQLGPL